MRHPSPLLYKSLKQKTPKMRQCASDIDRDWCEYSLIDERTAMRMSYDASSYILAVSVGKLEKSLLSFFRTVESKGDIVSELDDAFELVSHAIREQISRQPKLLEFVVNDAVDVKVYAEKGTDRCFVQMFGDEIIVNNTDISDAKQQTISKVAQLNYSIDEKQSFVQIGSSRFSWGGEIPLIHGFVASFGEYKSSLHDYSHRIDDYSSLGLCHLYKDGACIAKVTLSESGQVINLTHPATGLLFEDLLHAASYTFGAPVCANNKIPSIFSSNDLHAEQGSQLSFACQEIAERHGCLVDDVFSAIDDMFSGCVFGDDIRKENRLFCLYADIAQTISQVVPDAQPLLSSWLNKIERIKLGLTPTQADSLTVFTPTIDTKVYLNESKNEPDASCRYRQ